ncbi:histidine kinase [Peptostreptococcaceae bacterium OttesenSCG-928-C18]|nr:histidine kinase [Peptostreptococcaceae bacterium OttesenSCG-928-C18]
MNNIKSCLTIWFVTTLYLILNFNIGSSIISLISLGLLSLLFLIKRNLYKYLIYIVFLLLILVENKFVFFVPLYLYCILTENTFRNILLGTFSIGVIYYFFEKGHFLYIVMTFLFMILIKIKDIENFKLDNRYKTFVIHSKEKQLVLQTENEKLIEDQNKGLEIAILNERNRLARDIHDGVGHIISRSILQIGAMIILEEDELKKENLNNIKISLDESMTELRKSLHNLQKNNISLKEELNKIVKNYTFSEILFNYSLNEDKDLNFKYSIIYIVSECLNNIIKHSNATLVEINLRETNKNIFILIKDNGTKNKSIKYGIGLNSIETRVKTINGSLQISNKNGFRVFINIEKEEI